ncbi:hypothetical protein ACLI4B_29105 [Pseudomonas aeruginosa]
MPVDDERYWPPSPVRARPRHGRNRLSVDLHALIPLIALTFLPAGIVQDVVGLALPPVTVPLLGLAKHPPTAQQSETLQ